MRRYDEAAVDPAVGPITLVGKTIIRARGYSPLELERAGLTRADAARLGVPVDPTRRSMVGTNVLQLKRLAAG